VRPLVAIPARFSAQASALRYRAEVAARALVEAVYRAGGEPWVMHPDAAEAERRLTRADALLLPGGGDLAPHRYGATAIHDTVYDLDDEQDSFDLAAARYALAAGVPTLAICRGLQVVNVALGGTLRQHMDCTHRHVVHPVALADGSALAAARGAGKVDASCFHHQCVDSLGDGLRPAAWAADGTVEALELSAPRGWFVAVQWHPEDTPDQWLFDALVRNSCAARRGEG
jgi:putative glutamine amidotransferase